MTRLGMVAAAAATLAAVVLAPTVGQAQSVDAAARDLRTHDVTFESGAVTDQDLADLDRVTAQLQADGGYTKVVVLAHPVDTSSSARAFAGKVRDTLGGRGRVIVFDPRDVGIATNVPGEASKVNSAELAAIEAANRSNSFATGVLGAADTLGVTGSAGSGSGSGSSSVGGSVGGWTAMPLLDDRSHPDRIVFHKDLDIVTGIFESFDPYGIDQVRIQREVELYVSGAGRDRVSHESAFDLDRMRDELLQRSVAALVPPDHRGQRMSEDRRSGERHLERIPARRVGHERRFARTRRIDGREATDDLVDVQPHVLIVVVAERHRLAGPHAVDRVVERVHEHPPAELAVRHDVEPAVDLPLHHRADGLVL
jgi:hypothetical protein